MPYTNGQAYYGTFNTFSGTGALVNADSLPSASAIHNGAVDGSFTLTVANLSTGLYKITGTTPTYTAGDDVAIQVTATIGGIASGGMVDRWNVLPANWFAALITAGGLYESDAKAINAISTSSVTTVSAYIGWTQAATFDANNFLKVDVQDWLGTTVATPATAGIPDVNAKNINNVATTSVTTINAVIGTAVGLQIDGSGYIKVSSGTGTGQINLASGRPGINWADVINPTTTLDLSGTTIKGLDVTGNVNVTSINSISTSSVTAVAAIIGTGVAPQQDVSGYAKVSPGTSTGQINLASGRPGINWGDVTNPTTTNGLTGTTIATSQVVASVTGAVGSVTGNVGGNVVGSTASVTGNVGGNVVGTVASVLNQVIRTNTAQAGGASTITLDSGASATNNLYNTATIYIVSGTGAAQVNSISSYVGSTKVATVTNAWATTPDNTSGFIIFSTESASSGGSGGDPWPTDLPGAYAPGSAGYILGNMLANIIAINGGRSVSSFQQTGPGINFVVSKQSAYDGAYHNSLVILGPAGTWLDLSTAGTTYEVVDTTTGQIFGTVETVTTGTGDQAVQISLTNAQMELIGIQTYSSCKLIFTGGGYGAETVIGATGIIQVVP